jgi:RNA polymerase sigma-70 factor (ECF subfamily)
MGGLAGGRVTPLSLVRPSSSTADDEVSPASGAPPLSDVHVEAAKRGDPGSWEAAYLAYGRALMGYLMVRLDNRDDAAEALSETFLRAIDKASSFRGDAYAFRAWLFTIARHVSTDHHRRRTRLTVLPEYVDTEDRSQPSGEDLAILHEDVAELRNGFARLSEAEQEILWLRICAGLSAADVGAVVGKRPGAVRMQQMRALESLRDRVKL